VQLDRRPLASEFRWIPVSRESDDDCRHTPESCRFLHDLNRIRRPATQVALRAESAFTGLTRHGKWSTASSTLGWQMRECPLSRHLANGSPGPLVPPDAGRGFSFLLLIAAFILRPASARLIFN
jgi:hypothetical protein